MDTGRNLLVNRLLHWRSPVMLLSGQVKGSYKVHGFGTEHRG